MSTQDENNYDSTQLNNDTQDLTSSLPAPAPINNNNNTNAVSLKTTMETLDHLAQQFKIDSSQQANASSSLHNTTATITHLRHLRRSLRDIAALSQSKQNELNALIEKSLQQQSELQSELSKESPALAIQQQQQERNQQKSREQQKVNILKDQLNTLQSSKQELKQSEHEYELRKKQIQQQRNATMPTAVRTLQLYSQFSSIQWQYKLCSQDRIVGRFIFDDEIIPFDYKINENQSTNNQVNQSSQQQQQQSHQSENDHRIMMKRAQIADELWNTMWLKSKAKQQEKELATMMQANSTKTQTV
jgi:hypothetical protein